MTTLKPATQTQPQPAQSFTFCVAATGAVIRLQADNYLAALPKILATCNALDTSKIELLQGDKDAIAIHEFVAEYGVGVLDQLISQHVSDDGGACPPQRVTELLDGFVGAFDDMEDVGKACLEAIDSSLDSALADHADLFDFAAYARYCENEGHMFTVQNADQTLLFVAV